MTGNPQRNITQYVVTVSSEDGMEQQVVVAPAEAAAVYTITGLQPATTYDIGVYIVINTVGQGEQTYDFRVPSLVITTREYSNVCVCLTLISPYLFL